MILEMRKLKNPVSRRKPIHTSKETTVPNLLKAFAEKLKNFGITELEAMDNVVYGVNAEWRIGYLNPAWQQFARDNGGEPGISQDWNLGRSIMDAIPAGLQPFYREAYRGCLTSGKPWHHNFECSSPTVYRRYRQTAYPLPSGAGLLIVNAVVSEHPHERLAAASIHKLSPCYADDNGIIHQCCHCRRIRHPNQSGRWDWVPTLVETPSPCTSHTLCSACLDFYYPDDTPDHCDAPLGEGQ